MTALLGFILQCGAVAALIGVTSSVLLAIVAIPSKTLFQRFSPAVRADLGFIAGVLPAALVIAGTLGAAAPSIFSALGVAPDHCAIHDHHPHLCILHSSGVGASLAMAGAVAWAVWFFRAATLAKGTFDLHSGLRALERMRLGPPEDGIIRVPGAPRLCHALGFWRGSILISQSLAERLDPVDLRCAIEHEQAHLFRKDPFAHLILSIAALFHAPLVSAVFRRVFRSGAEEACDDAAARAIGDSARVAHALIAVARAQRGAVRVADASGFAEHDLEQRIRRLLTLARPSSGRARGLLYGAVAACSAAVIAAWHMHDIHHAVETTLQSFF